MPGSATLYRTDVPLIPGEGVVLGGKPDKGLLYSVAGASIAERKLKRHPRFTVIKHPLISLSPIPNERVKQRKRAALYRWDGAAAQLAAELKDFNAESVVNAGDHWLVLSDNGKDKRTGEEADDGDRTCDKIRRKNSRGENHPNVFFKARKVAK